MCGDRHLADDLVQETLAKAYRQLSRVQRAGSPAAYVYRMLVNEARSHWRRHGRVHTEAEVGTGTAPDATEHLAHADELVRAMLQLPVPQRAALVLTASAPAVPANYQESLTVNATSGLQEAFGGGSARGTRRA